MVIKFQGKRKVLSMVDDYANNGMTREEVNRSILKDITPSSLMRSCHIGAFQYIIEELDKLVGYYEQPQDRFEMGFRQGIYRAKMKVEELLKRYKEC